MSTLNETPGSNRIHIGIFGRTNSGKSSLINALTGQNISIVADQAGTTTDPVYKPMEINPLGPCVLIDTAGFDDHTQLGAQRLEKTRLAAQKTDIAIIVVSAKELCDENSSEYEFYRDFTCRKTPVLIVVNSYDDGSDQDTASFWKDKNANIVEVNCKSGQGIGQLKSSLARLLPEDYDAATITGNLVEEDDLVLLVMPQDIQAPKGRLILPQVQTIRELLDKKCIVMSVTTDKLVSSLKVLSRAPKLIITDSQVFDYVYENKPKESMLTSFSVLFAAYKGDIEYYVESAKAIDALTEESRVLIAECCTHAPLSEDIGREKIPAMLKKRFGKGLTVDIVSGTDFPEDLSGYDLVIQCGACMFNRKYVLSRIDKAKLSKTPMTNYGVTIAHLKGILDKVEKLC